MNWFSELNNSWPSRFLHFLNKWPSKLNNYIHSSSYKRSLHLNAYNLLFYLGATLIPLSLQISWQSFNNFYPYADGGDYFITAQEIYKKFEQEGLFKGLEGLYFHRGWRPILFPTLAVPFLMITGGDVLSSVSLALSFFYFVLLHYTYLISKQFLPPLHALLATVFLGTVPWIADYGHIFMSELPLLSMSFGAIYHLLKSQFFKNHFHSLMFGLFLGIAIAIRPVESVLAFWFPLVICIYFAYKNKTISRLEVLLTIGLFVGTVFLLVCGIIAPLSQTEILVGAGILLCFWLFLVANTERFKLSKSYILAFSACHLVATLWWLGGIKRLFDWIYQTSFGSVARLYVGSGQKGIWEGTTDVFMQLGGAPLFISAAIAIFGILGQKPLKVFKPFLRYALVCFIMIFPFLIIQSFTETSDFRRIFIGFAFLLLTSYIVAVHPEGRMHAFRFALSAILVFVQGYMIFATTYDLPKAYYQPLTNVFRSISSPFRDQDPSIEVYEKLASLKRLSKGSNLIASLGQVFLLPNLKSFDTRTLTIMSNKNDSHMTFGYPWEFSKEEDGFHQLKKHSYNYILVGYRSLEALKSRSDSHSRLASWILEKWEHSQLEPLGVTFASSFEVSNRYYLLFRLNIPGFGSEKNLALDLGSHAGSNIPPQKGFPEKFINDGSPSPWGAIETSKDTVFFVSHPKKFQANLIRLMLFSTNQGGHLRDISVVATNDQISSNTKWVVINSKINSDDVFGEKITIPNKPDKTVISIELQNQDHFTTYGIACFSESKGFKRNYLSSGRGIYSRELAIFSN